MEGTTEEAGSLGCVNWERCYFFMLRMNRLRRSLRTPWTDALEQVHGSTVLCSFQGGRHPAKWGCEVLDCGISPSLAFNGTPSQKNGCGGRAVGVSLGLTISQACP
jgi:hypothetical protein